jgi:hypothetical protein
MKAIASRTSGEPNIHWRLEIAKLQKVEALGESAIASTASKACDRLHHIQSAIASTTSKECDRSLLFYTAQARSIP